MCRSIMPFYFASPRYLEATIALEILAVKTCLVSSQHDTIRKKHWKLLNVHFFLLSAYSKILKWVQ
ncbi:CLUMA_CG019755, isoform A [Clunio marinus]|uniref:CLUMA_CG019755, isoform A n=1 Tax=Clunio marinus TaxID=568069 RepID=A0A1J1J4Q7_9DIPT|nr:CLUMA_CG019755, isoform A [Clunio marinus]